MVMGKNKLTLIGNPTGTNGFGDTVTVCWQ